MGPGDAANNLPDLPALHPVHLGKHHRRYVFGCFASDLSNLHLGEFSKWVKLARTLGIAATPTSALPPHIVRVISTGPKKKMVRVDAPRNITAMQHTNLSTSISKWSNNRKWVDPMLVSQSMCKLQVASNPKLAVPSISRTTPQPASAVRLVLNLLKKSAEGERVHTSHYHS